MDGSLQALPSLTCIIIANWEQFDIESWISWGAELALLLGVCHSMVLIVSSAVSMRR
jgi:hypothetical protein